MGAVPKRSEHRTRRNKLSGDGIETKRGQGNGIKEWPEPSEDWHPAIVRLFESLRISGMAQFYEQTDVEMAWVSCEGMNRWLSGSRPSGQTFESFYRAFERLGATEAERRRMHIELETSEVFDEDAESTADILAFQSNLRVVE